MVVAPFRRDASLGRSARKSAMFAILFLALVAIWVDVSSGFSGKGCLTRLEAAIKTCSQIGDQTPFMDCIRTHKAHSINRRHCLNVQGIPQLWFSGADNMRPANNGRSAWFLGLPEPTGSRLLNAYQLLMPTTCKNGPR